MSASVSLGLLADGSRTQGSDAPASRRWQVSRPVLGAAGGSAGFPGIVPGLVGAVWGTDDRRASIMIMSFHTNELPWRFIVPVTTAHRDHLAPVDSDLAPGRARDTTVKRIRINLGCSSSSMAAMA